MYTVTLQNFDHMREPYLTYPEALARAKSVGFESSVWFTGQDNNRHLVASYSPLYGLDVHNRELAGMEPGLTLFDAIAINGEARYLHPKQEK